MSTLRAFPVVYGTDVVRSADFWEKLGFERFVQLPADDEPGYVGLRRETSEIAIVSQQWPAQHCGMPRPPTGPRFEM
jgi:lactoylglutathione lyase